MGPVHHPVVGQGGHGLGQLDGGVGVVTLADTDGNGFPGVPLLLFWALEAAAFPGRGGQHPFGLALNIHPGALSETELANELGNGVNTHVVGQHVVIGVAGLNNGLVEIHPAMATLFVVTELVTAEIKKARVHNGLGRSALTQFQGPQGHIGLKGGAGGIGTVDSPVEHGLIRVVVEAIPVIRADAVHKQVGIIGGLRNQGQNAAGGGVNGHHGAPPSAEGGFGNFLELGIQGQGQVIAGHGESPGQHPHRMAPRIHLHLLVTRLTVQLEFVMLLQAGFAEMFRALVIGVFFRVRNTVQVIVVDPADVAQGVGSQFPQGILAEEAGLHLHPRETVAVGSEFGHFLIRQPGADGDGLKILGVFQKLAKAFPVLGGHFHQLTQGVDHLIQGAIHLGGSNFQGKGGVVAGQHHPVPVHDQAPIGQDGHQGNTVFFGPGAVVIVLHHLEPDKAAHQENEGDQHQGTGHPQAVAILLHLPIRRVEVVKRHGKRSRNSDGTVFVPLHRLVLG